MACDNGSNYRVVQRPELKAQLLMLLAMQHDIDWKYP